MKTSPIKKVAIMKAKSNIAPAKPKSTKMTRKNTSPQPPSLFQQAFLSVICFTLLSGGVSLSLATKDSLSPEQASIVKTCNDVCKIGMIALCGLLGSKAVQDDDDE
jgi:hypothetical protein